MSKPVPSLTSAGWLETIAEKADALMANYLTSDYSQTHCYKGQVTSLAYHIKEYGDDMLILEKRVRADLTKYLNRYFDNTDVSVTTSVPYELEPEKVNLQIDVIVFQDSLKYSLGREIQTVSDKVVNVFKINNG